MKVIPLAIAGLMGAGLTYSNVVERGGPLQVAGRHRNAAAIGGGGNGHDGAGPVHIGTESGPLPVGRGPRHHSFG